MSGGNTGLLKFICCSLPLTDIQFLFQKFACITIRTSGNLLRGATNNQTPSFVASLRTQVDNVVGTFDDIKIMFDDDQGMATFKQSIESNESMSCMWRPVVGSSNMKIVGSTFSCPK